MLLLECPYCGVKAEETELSPGYEAHLKRFGPGSTDEEFEAYMFARKNPKGVHFERWRHTYGCGKWFLAARCTATLSLRPISQRNCSTHAVCVGVLAPCPRRPSSRYERVDSPKPPSRF